MLEARLHELGRRIDDAVAQARERLEKISQSSRALERLRNGWSRRRFLAMARRVTNFRQAGFV